MHMINLHPVFLILRPCHAVVKNPLQARHDGVEFMSLFSEHERWPEETFVISCS